MSEKKQFRNFRKKQTEIPLTREQKIEQFVLRNSRNGFFTKFSTLPYKFELTESKAWDIVGELLTNGLVESTHDESTGEMKLCEYGKMYKIMNLEKKRKNDKRKTSRKKTSKEKSSRK